MRKPSLRGLVGWPLLALSLAVAASCGSDSRYHPPDDGGAAADLPLSGGSDLATLGSDGTPMRTACTASFGSAMTAVHGRLDGYLIALVPPGVGGCSGDSSHLHLQILMGGAVYNIAVTTIDMTGGSVFFLARDLSVGGAWSEGWHPGANLDYVVLGFHATDFAAQPEPMLLQTLQTELANANHLSVFATGFGPSGGHLVHRKGNNSDGAIVINPLSATPHVLMFHFANQSF